MHHNKEYKSTQVNGCFLQVAMFIMLALPLIFGAPHGGIQSGKGVSIGPNNRPASKDGCMIYIVPLFGIIGGIAALIGKMIA